MSVYFTTENKKITELIKTTEVTDGKVYLTDDDGEKVVQIYETAEDFVCNTIVGRGADFSLEVVNGKACVYIPD